MKAAVITGGARGIGKAIAHELLGRGFRRLAITARTREKLQAAEESLTAAGAQVLAFAADVCDCEAMGAVVREVIETFGRVDLWVNNAGVAQRKAFAATTPAEWDEMIDVNLRGVLICTYLILPYMLANGEGMIVNIASGAGKTGFAELSVYCATKFAVVGFTESLAKELGGYGVKVWAVCPGATDTRMYRSLFPEREPVRRPEEVARVIGKLVTGELAPPLGSCVEAY